MHTKASTVLMVDDNEDEIFLTRHQMRKDGFINQFVSERRPEQVISRIRQLREMGESVIVLLDISMPRIDGFSLLEKMKSDSSCKDVPVVMYSASSDESDIFEAIELGADGYVVKPFRSSEFMAVIDGITGVKKCLVQ